MRKRTHVSQCIQRSSQPAPLTFQTCLDMNSNRRIGLGSGWNLHHKKRHVTGKPFPILEQHCRIILGLCTGCFSWTASLLSCSTPPPPAATSEAFSSMSSLSSLTWEHFDCVLQGPLHRIFVFQYQVFSWAIMKDNKEGASSWYQHIIIRKSNESYYCSPFGHWMIKTTGFLVLLEFSRWAALWHCSQIPSGGFVRKNMSCLQP